MENIETSLERGINFLKISLVIAAATPSEILMVFTCGIQLQSDESMLPSSMEVLLPLLGNSSK